MWKRGQEQDREALGTSPSGTGFPEGVQVRRDETILDIYVTASQTCFHVGGKLTAL